MMIYDTFYDIPFDTTDKQAWSTASMLAIGNLTEDRIFTMAHFNFTHS